MEGHIGEERQVIIELMFGGRTCVVVRLVPRLGYEASVVTQPCKVGILCMSEREREREGCYTEFGVKRFREVEEVHILQGNGKVDRMSV